MAEAILSNLAAKILKGLGSLLVQELGLASGVKKELRKLEESLSKTNAILLDAEKKGAINNEVKDWLRKLKDVAYDVEDVLDGFATEALRQKVEFPNNMVVKQVRRCFSHSNPLVFRLKMAHRIKDIIERLDLIQKDPVYFTFQSATQSVDTDHIIDDDNDRRHTDPFVIESITGRDKDRENLVELLTSSGVDEGNNNKVMVIPIIGIGGLGKTTLAQYVYNDERIKTRFELRMWVCVSFDFNVSLLVKKILESLSNKKCADLKKTQLKSELMEKLCGKRYLLVLDDVWNDDPGKWERLRKLLMSGANGSMILVTTRSQEVASFMHPIKSFYLLQGLNENDCASLFNERAFGRGKETNHLELVEIGKGIARKCGGVPLAAKALGSLLCLKRNKKDWLDILNTEIWNLGAQEHEILPALRISYDHLPSHLKQCFAYCSLFPQDHKIDVHELIHQWMSHGFVSPHATMSLEDIGYRGFRELFWRSFFQDIIEDDLGNIIECKMHDLMHNLARWVAGNEWSEVVAEISSITPPISSFVSQGVRHMVFPGKKLEDTLNHHTLQIPFQDKPQKLRTLYLEGEYEFGTRSSAGFDSSLRGLRVLKLSYLRMKDVPSSIGYLEQLRYLDLSGNYFKALPNSICRLYNLQTLRLAHCMYLSKWPRDMTKLVSLAHLELNRENKLLYMPHGLGKFASLQRLDFFIVGDPNDPTTNRKGSLKIGRLGELHGLNQLRGGLVIRGLGNVRVARDAEEANLKDKSELQSLEMDWWPNWSSKRLLEESVFGNLQPHPNLKALKIRWYVGLKMPRWMIHSPSLLPNLVELRIINCPSLKCWPLVGEFPCLRYLHLSQLNDLEFISNKVVMPVRGNNRSGEEVKPLVLFPSLEELRLDNAPTLKGWTISVLVEEEDEGGHNHLHLLSSMFPRLTDLKFSCCYELTKVPFLSVGGKHHLTSLRKLRLFRLERLVSLPDCPAPATLEELHIRNSPCLVRLPDCFFENLKLLSKFEIEHCKELNSLPEGIRHLTALKLLKIEECPRFTTLPECLGNLGSLRALEVLHCSNLSSLPEGIQQLPALETLKIYYCPALKASPDGLRNLAVRGVLEIRGCPNLPKNLRSQLPPRTDPSSATGLFSSPFDLSPSRPTFFHVLFLVFCILFFVFGCWCASQTDLLLQF